MIRPLQLMTVDVKNEQDVVLARQRARQIANCLGYDLQDQTRIGTATSEIVRNAFRYAHGCRVGFTFEQGAHRRLVISVVDAGPGIAQIDEILAGRYISKTGMGMGLLGTRRIMDRVEIDTAVGKGTTVTMTKFLPAKAPPLDSNDFADIARTLAQGIPGNALGEIQQQNQELLALLNELNQRQGELLAVNKELEDTNRGVVALYAELDARADFLKKTTEVKSRFLSNMTHEFRTPLNSIIALSNMLLDRADGDLGPEQERQVSFIAKSAQELTTLVNDLLDIAKVDAGRVRVRAAEFRIGDLFGALKGMLRPLLSPNAAVSLNFGDPDADITMVSDEGKVSQILRNLISNALKFTVQGEVKVDVSQRADGHIVFSVADTGVGISPENVAIIFEEFGQVETNIEQRFKGSGLGLPLSKRLAELLNGQLQVTSMQGFGSTFRLVLPARYLGDKEGNLFGAKSDTEGKHYVRQVLIIDDDDVSRYLIRGLLPKNFEMNEVAVASDALPASVRLMPDAIFLNIHFGTAMGSAILHQLKEDQRINLIPVVTYTPRLLDANLRAECALADSMLEVGADARTAHSAMAQILGRIGLLVDEVK